MPDNKVCKTCFTEKPMSEYYFRKETGKHKTICKKCVIAGNKIFRDPENKICKHCGESKPFSEYQKAGGGNWLQPYCKPCDSYRKSEWAKKNKDWIIKKSRNNYIKKKSENPDFLKEYYRKNKDRIKEWQLKNTEKNKEKISKRQKEFRLLNRDEIRLRQKNYRLSRIEISLKKEAENRAKRTPEQRERVLAKQREWHEKNKERVNKRTPEKMAIRREQKRIWCNRMAKTVPEFKILKSLRSRTRFALMKDGAVKSNTTEQLLGCSIPEFKCYFESKFSEGMNWERFLDGDIHIDHKITMLKI